MKILFKVTNLYKYFNEKSKEHFVKLELVKSINKKEEYSKKQKIVVYHIALKTSLKEGDTFMFDSEIYDMIEKIYIDEDGLERTTREIRLKPINIK